MLEPYTTRPKERGTPNATDEELNRIVTMMDRRGWQIMIHAIGDRAIRQALDAYEHAATVNPAPDACHAAIASSTSRPSTPPTSRASARSA